MIVTHELEMDFNHRGATPLIDVVQDDKYSRNLSISLYSKGKKWIPGQGASAAVRYIKEDGTGGSYNFLPDETPAWQIEDNVVTVALAPQVCTAAGRVKLVVAVVKDAAQISSFLIELNVQGNPGLQVTSQDYYKLSGTVPIFGWEPGKFLGTNEEGNVVAVEPPEQGVMSINGVPPDETGNISISFSAMPKPATASVGQYLRVKSVDHNGVVTAVDAAYLDVSEVTECLYNGIEMPVLPDEIAAFPYRFIQGITSGDLTAYYAYGIAEEPATWVDSTIGSTLRFGTPEGAVSGRMAIWNAGHPAWVLYPDDPLTVSIALSGYLYKAPGLIWSSTDVSDSEGSLLLTGSDPALVYSSGSDSQTQADPDLPHIVLTTVMHTESETELNEEDCEKLRTAAQTGIPVLITFPLIHTDSESEVTLHIMLDHLVQNGDHVFTRDFRLLFVDNQVYIACIYPADETWTFGIMAAASIS